MEKGSYSQIIEDSIRLHFERNGILDEMRSGLHVKVLKMMRGEMDLKRDEPLCGGDMQQRGLLQLLNYLVVDYFAWYGYKHTLETFALETGDKCQEKPREKLQREFGDDFVHKELPILLQMLMKQTNKMNDNKLQKDKSERIETKRQSSPTKKLAGARPVIKDIPPEGNPSIIPKMPRQNLTPRDIQPKNNPSKPIKLHPTSPLKKKDIRTPLAKVNVRQSMVESVKQKQSPKYAKSKINATAAISRKNQHSSDSESSSQASAHESGSDDGDTSYDSDAFAEIPNRYYYREQEPPEKLYPDGFGEEGPYENPSQSRVRNQLNSRSIVKRKPLRIYEMQNDIDKEKPHCSNRDNPKSKPKSSDQNTPKRNKCLFQSQKHIISSDNDLHMPVSKPKCPETMVGRMQESTEDSDEDSNEDSDEYL
ncbi:trans-Golgi network integral membrane protein 2 [Drosophila montana]|uniref:trans-Golgi network integral membrane protein 2 n=1 Tax=Drosophila montana TaxID=40370 RepID=UPI00313DC54C